MVKSRTEGKSKIRHKLGRTRKDDQNVTRGKLAEEKKGVLGLRVHLRHQRQCPGSFRETKALGSKCLSLLYSPPSSNTSLKTPNATGPGIHSHFPIIVYAQLKLEPRPVGSVYGGRSKHWASRRGRCALGDCKPLRVKSQSKVGATNRPTTVRSAGGFYVDGT